MADETQPNQEVSPPPQETRGAATTFDKATYNVNSMMYPDDLMSNKNQYGGNYVIFYINVHEDSTLYASDSGDFVAGDKVGPRLKGEMANLSEQQVQNSVTAQSVGAGMAAGPVDKALGYAGVDLKKNLTVDIGKGLANGAVGGLIGTALISQVGGAKKEYKRMRGAIALYVPTDLSIKYGVQYEETNLAGTNALAQGLPDELKDLFDSSYYKGAASSAMNYVASLALNVPGAGEAISRSAGIAPNPKKEQIFKQVDYRTFTFSYQFFAKSREEAINIREIIKAFKLHMHPEYKKDSGNFLYLYPSEFDIFYYQNEKENLNLHRHTSCVLTDMNISYAPQGMFTTFEDGMPTQINVTLTFKELALLTKKQILDNY